MDVFEELFLDLSEQSRRGETPCYKTTAILELHYKLERIANRIASLEDSFDAYMDALRAIVDLSKEIRSRLESAKEKCAEEDEDG